MVSTTDIHVTMKSSRVISCVNVDLVSLAFQGQRLKSATSLWRWCLPPSRDQPTPEDGDRDSIQDVRHQLITQEDFITYCCHECFISQIFKFPPAGNCYHTQKHQSYATWRIRVVLILNWRSLSVYLMSWDIF